MEEVVWNCEEKALLPKTESVIEDSLKPQPGVFRIYNARKQFVKTSAFNFLVENNRKAFNLDFVTVGCRPINEWTLNTSKLRDVFAREKSRDGNRSKSPNSKQERRQLTTSLSDMKQQDLIRLLQHPSRASFIKKKGDLSSLTHENHPRVTIGSFVGKADDGKAIIEPFDRKLPKIYVDSNYLRVSHKNHAYIVTIDSWPNNSTNPIGTVAETIEISNLDYDYVVTQALIENEIETRSFSIDFEDNILINYKITENDFAGRLDLREETVFTIDPTNATDIDDALSCKKVSDGVYEVGIHIADVTHFVKPGTVLDEMARKRNVSVYLPGKYIPMLPAVLSQNLCSLLPGKERLAVSAILTINDDGTVMSEQFKLSVIKSKLKLTYDEAEKIIKGTLLGNRMPETKTAIRTLHKLAQSIRMKRMASDNVFNLESKGSSFLIEELPNEEYEVKEKVPSSRLHSQILVEEMMILANSHVAKFLYTLRPNTSLVRCHSPIPEKLLFNLKTLCNDIVYYVNVSNLKELQTSLLEIIEDKMLENADLIGQTLIHLVYRSNRRANYECSGVMHSIGKSVFHSALNTVYTHFTSPIRRYADILVHRMLKDALEGKQFEEQKRIDEIAMNAVLCNARKSVNQKVSAKCRKFLMKVFINQKGPFDEQSVVVAVHRKYFVVFVKRFSLFVKIHFEDMEGITESVVLSVKKKPGHFKATISTKSGTLMIQPLDIVSIHLSCDVNKSKRCYELKGKLNVANSK